MLIIKDVNPVITNDHKMNRLEDPLIVISRWLDVWSLYRCRRVCVEWKRVLTDMDVIPYLRSLLPDRDTTGYTERQLLMCRRHPIWGCSFPRGEVISQTLSLSSGSRKIHKVGTVLPSPVRGFTGVKEFCRHGDVIYMLDYWGRIHILLKKSLPTTFINTSFYIVKLFTTGRMGCVYAVDYQGVVYYVDPVGHKLLSVGLPSPIAGVIGRPCGGGSGYIEVVDIQGNCYGIVEDKFHRVKRDLGIVRVGSGKDSIHMEMRGDILLYKAVGEDGYRIVTGVGEVATDYTNNTLITKKDGTVLAMGVYDHEGEIYTRLVEVFNIK